MNLVDHPTLSYHLSGSRCTTSRCIKTAYWTISCGPEGGQVNYQVILLISPLRVFACLFTYIKVWDEKQKHFCTQHKMCFLKLKWDINGRILTRAMAAVQTIGGNGHWPKKGTQLFKDTASAEF